MGARRVHADRSVLVCVCVTKPGVRVLRSGGGPDLRRGVVRAGRAGGEGGEAVSRGARVRHPGGLGGNHARPGRPSGAASVQALGSRVTPSSITHMHKIHQARGNKCSRITVLVKHGPFARGKKADHDVATFPVRFCFFICSLGVRFDEHRDTRVANEGTECYST